MTIDRLISCILELYSLVILWSKFERGKHFPYFKNTFIVTMALGMAYLTNDVEPIGSFIINYGFLVIALTIVHKKALLDSLVKIIISYSCIMLIEVAILIVLVSIYGTGIDVQEPKILLIACIALLIMSIIIYTNKYLDSAFNKIHKYLSSVYFKFKNIWILNTLIYCMFIKIIWDYSPKYLMNYRFIILFISILLYFININIFKNDLLRQEKANMESYYNRYSPVMELMVEDVKSKQHEFKNHINALYGLTQLADEPSLRDEVLTYLESLNDSLSKVDIVKSRHNIINAIIYSKVCEAKDRDIDFKYYIKDIEVLPMKPYEVSEVLSNLLNNAFEEVYKNSLDNRIVELIITDDENSTILEVKNTVSDIKQIKTDKLFKRGFSTKGRGSGYGLFNVKRIVEENKGKIMVTIDSNCISFTVTFDY